jgi:hypothetical protein
VDSLSGDKPVQPEVQVDPVLEKYMAIVKQQKETEKQQVGLNVKLSPWANVV